MLRKELECTLLGKVARHDEALVFIVGTSHLATEP